MLTLFRVLLRLQMEHASEGAGEGGEAGAQYWTEFVHDLWQQKLPHLREVYESGGGMFVYDPATDHYGFQEGSEYDDGGEFGLMEEFEKDPEDFQREGEETQTTDDIPDIVIEPDESFVEGSEAQATKVSHTYDLAQDSSDEEKDSSFSSAKMEEQRKCLVYFLALI